jgi:hypothetical protein
MPEILTYASPSGRDTSDVRDLVAMHRAVGWLLIGLAVVLFLLLSGYLVFISANDHRFDLHDMLYPPPNGDPAFLIDAVCLAIGGAANLVSGKWIEQRRRRGFSLGVAAVNLLFCVLIFPGLLGVRTFRTLCRREIKAQYREVVAI